MSDCQDSGDKKSSRRPITRLQIYPDLVEANVARIELHFRDAEQRTNFVNAAREPKATAELKRKCEEVLRASREVRERPGLIQPQISPELLRGVKIAAQQMNAKSVSAFIIQNMGLWINFARGRRKRRKGTNRATRLSNLKAFQARGRKLARADDLVRLYINVGAAKDAVLSLVKDSQLSLTEFFCALAERISDPDQVKSPVGELFQTTLPNPKK